MTVDFSTYRCSGVISFVRRRRVIYFSKHFFLLLVPYTYIHTITFFFPPFRPSNDYFNFLRASYSYSLVFFFFIFSLHIQLYTILCAMVARDASRAAGVGNSLYVHGCTQCIRMYDVIEYIYISIYLMQVSEVITRCCLAVWLNAFAFKLRRSRA